MASRKDPPEWWCCAIHTKWQTGSIPDGLAIVDWKELQQFGLTAFLARQFPPRIPLSSFLVCSILRVACTEEPPPSGRAVAARLRSHRGHLKKTFPEVWQLILQRHAQYRKQEVSRKRAAFAERVRRIATDVLMAGKYPSRRRVLALMDDSELRGEHSILPEVRRAILAFRSSYITSTEVGPIGRPPAFPA